MQDINAEIMQDYKIIFL